MGKSGRCKYNRTFDHHQNNPVNYIIEYNIIMLPKHKVIDYSVLLLVVVVSVALVVVVKEVLVGQIFDCLRQSINKAK